MSDEKPQPDRIEGAPHPRETVALLGQASAEAAFLEAFATQRLHHAWLITGPRGVGKATLAWRIARFLLATPDVAEDDMFGAPPPNNLDIPDEHPVARRIAAGADPGLVSVVRSVNEKTDRLRNEIVVDDIRRLNGFFQMSAADGGRRVVIVDAADEMNVSAANALLKTLEEPPERATLLLVSHQPSRLLPTIRSRCRTLRLHPLAPDDLSAALAQAGVEVGAEAQALSALAGGSVGDAIRLKQLGGLEIYAEIVALLNSLPQFDRQRGLALAEAAAQRGAEDRLDLLFTLFEVAFARLARTGATGAAPSPEAAPGEAAAFLRLCSNPGQARAWAETAQETLARARHGRAVNLDPAALVLDTLIKLQQTAA